MITGHAVIMAFNDQCPLPNQTAEKILPTENPFTTNIMPASILTKAGNH